MTARWTLDVPTEPQDGRQERLGRGALPSALASLDARLCAWIVGLTVAALLCLFFGDALAGWAGVR